MRPSPMMARRRFFVEQIREGAATISGDDAAHLVRVLRVEPGQRFEISDNQAAWLAEITEARKSLVTFRLIEPVASPPPLVPVHLYAALFKFDRFEWMLEKVTELGVERVIPVETERSEHGLLAASQKRVERWRKIVREASQQSRRTRMPEVCDAIRFGDLPVSGRRYLLDELSGTPRLEISPPSETDQPISLILGPEGGWTEEERAALIEAEWMPGSLGPLVLRAETAAIAAVSIVIHALCR